MTEEQIEQRAERYAETYVSKTAAYIGGAHSRDEEVEMLQNQKEELSEQLKMNAENIQKLRNPWISVEDRLPDREETFLCALDNGVYVTDCYDYERNRWNSFPDSITHWMPIPTIPKLDKKE